MTLRKQKDPGLSWNLNVKPLGPDIDRYVRSQPAQNEDSESNASAMEQKQEASGPYHSVLVEERIWTANWINQ